MAVYVILIRNKGVNGNLESVQPLAGGLEQRAQKRQNVGPFRSNVFIYGGTIHLLNYCGFSHFHALIIFSV